MLFPKKVKHRKWHRLDVNRLATRRTSIDFGSFGLQSQTGSWITARQIESARRAMTRHLKRGGKIWIRVFPSQPVTLKGGEIRMGGGKGAVDHYVANVPAGTVLFEIDGVEEEVAREAFRLASHKLPVKTSILSKG